MEQLDLYLTNMYNAVANAATVGSLDAADISRMTKNLDTLTVVKSNLVKEAASI